MSDNKKEKEKKEKSDSELELEKEKVESSGGRQAIYGDTVEGTVKEDD